MWNIHKQIIFGVQYSLNIIKRKRTICLWNWDQCYKSILKIPRWGRSQDGGGIGRGDQFLFYKFMERTTERWTKFTKQLLIASGGHQAPRKAAHCLQREVGQGYWRLKRGDKRTRDGDPSWEGSLYRGSFQSPGNPGTGGSEGIFQISEGYLTGMRN